MPTLKSVVDGFVSQRDHDNAAIGRCTFRVGDRELIDITPKDVDAALARLVEHGRLRLR